jgi:hypothetical protein
MKKLQHMRPEEEDAATSGVTDQISKQLSEQRSSWLGLVLVLANESGRSQSCAGESRQFYPPYLYVASDVGRSAGRMRYDD